jgi:hypothetical protein
MNVSERFETPMNVSERFGTFWNVLKRNFRDFRESYVLVK